MENPTQNIKALHEFLKAYEQPIHELCTFSRTLMDEDACDLIPKMIEDEAELNKKRKASNIPIECAVFMNAVTLTAWIKTIETLLEKLQPPSD